MNISKKLGVWMDHTKALILEGKNNSITSYSIESLSLQSKKQNFGMDESLRHNREQEQLSDFFKKLSAIIMDHSEIILFGPTTAKTEFYNIIKKDSHFNNIKIDIDTTNNITENQINAYVNEILK